MTTFIGNPGQNDTFTGADNVTDIFQFAVADLNSLDTLVGGAGSTVDILQFTTSGTVAASAFANVSGIERITLSNGANSLTLTNALVSSANGTYLTVFGNAGNDTVNASGVTTATNRVEMNANAGNDTLTGGSGNDIFKFAATELASTDTVVGGSGSDALLLSGTGTVAAAALANVSGLEQIGLGAGGINISIGNAVALANAASLIVQSGAGSDTVNASAIVSTTRRIDVTAGSGNDVLTGGAGADVFRFAAADLSSSDTVAGGAGASVDILLLSTAGAVSAATLANISGIERMTLASGVNSLTLTDALVGSANGTILVVSGSAGNDVVNASAVTTAANRADITAGAGDDALTGGAGGDIFRFVVADLSSADAMSGGGGSDALLLTGSAATIALPNLTGMEQISLGIGGVNLSISNAVALANATTLTITSASASDTVNASAITSAANRIDVIAGAGNDTFTGGAGADLFRFGATSLTNLDTVSGGTGASVDILQVSTAGAVSAAALTNVSGIERITLANGTNSLTVANTLVSSANGTFLVVNGGTGNDTVDASGVITATNRVDISAARADTLTAGSGNDFLRFVVTDLTSADTATGGAGTDALALTGTGTAAAAALTNVTGMEQITLGTGGINLTISNAVALANAASLIVSSGAGSDTVNASGITSAANRIDVTAGTGNDSFTGGAGADQFRFAAADLASTDTVAGGAGASVDILLFNTAGTVGAAAAANVSGIERVTLANGLNSLTLTNAMVGSADATLLTVIGNAGNDTVSASGVATAANRVDLSGGAGTDTLTGGAGDDTLNGGTEADAMTGGAGNDSYVVDAGGDTTVEAAAGGTDSVQSSINLTLAPEVENLTLTGAATTGTGNGGANTIAGNSLANTLDGLGGNDTLNGAGGADNLTGGAGQDTVNGDAGNDTLFVNLASEIAAGETYDGGADTDTLNGNALASAVNLSAVTLSNFESIAGFGSGLTLTAAQLDQFSGAVNTGAVTLSGAGAVNIADADVFTSNFNLSAAGNSLTLTDEGLTVYAVNGAAAADTVTILGGISGALVSGNGGADTLTGGASADTLDGGANNDTLNGGGGADNLTGGAGQDTVNGDAGNDTLVVDVASEIAAGETYDGGADTDSLDGGSLVAAASLAGVTLSNLETIFGFFSGLTLAASQLDQFNNSINTGAITLSGAGAADISDATVQTNVFNLSAAGNSLTLDDDGTAFYTVNGGAAADTVTILGGTVGTTLNGNGGNDFLTGGSVADTLAGGADNDTLTGGGGDDSLTGGAGMDTVNGGAGNDTLFINVASEVVAGETYDGGTEVDTLNGGALATTVSLAGVTLSNLESITGFFSGLTLTASQLDQFNTMIGTGAITLSGAGAADISDAAVSTNIFNLSAAGNSLTLDDDGTAFYTVNGGAAADTVNILGGIIGTALNGNGGNDQLTGGVVADTLTGGANNDTLTGGDGADSLDGGADTDTLNGGAGDDTLTGGAGLDTVNGGSDNDTLFINVASEIVAGETYDGGTEADTLNGGGVTSAVSLAGVTLGNLESITGFNSGLTLTAAQLDQFNTTISTGAITLSGAGVADISDAAVGVNVFNLSAAGNSLTLDDDGSAGYTVNGGAAADTVTILGGVFGAALNGGGGNDALTGGSVADTLIGGANDDTLNGGGGDDALTGGAGLDTVNGGADNDTLFVNVASEIVAGETYDGGSEADTLNGDGVASAVSLAAATLSNLESITGFGSGLTLTASQLDQFTTTISTGAITLSGAGVADISDAAVGVNVFNLSAAGNTLTLDDDGSAGYTVNGGAAADTVAILGGVFGATLNGSGGNDTLTGGAVADTLTGGANNDTLTGGDGADSLDGGADTDTLNGGAGGDSLTGGAGLDTVNGDAGDDTLIINAASEIVAGETYNGGADADTLDGSGVGSAVSLATSTVSNMESITGFTGGLTLTAAQLDQFTGNVNTAAISFAGAGAANISDADVTTNQFFLSASGNSLTLTDEGFAFYDVNGGTAADTIVILGGANGTLLNGNGGADTLTGGSAADVLTGGDANDTMTGGGGGDSFVFTAAAPAQLDTVTDFNELNGGGEEGDLLMFQGIGNVGTFAYLGDGAFTNTGNTEARRSGNQVQVDLDGNASTDIFVTLTGLTSAAQLAITDFSFV